jgi:hypothetical protein
MKMGYHKIELTPLVINKSFTARKSFRAVFFAAIFQSLPDSRVFEYTERRSDRSPDDSAFPKFRGDGKDHG